MKRQSDKFINDLKSKEVMLKRREAESYHKMLVDPKFYGRIKNQLSQVN